MDYKELHFVEIDSTNKYLKDNYLSLDNFTIASTDYQSKGKGRNDRIWLSNKGENLMFSLLIKDSYLINLGGYLSLVAAISISKVLEDQFHLKDVSIKWPNDIYLNGEKVCGILLEGQLPHYLVIGIGINVNQITFIGEYRINPTSIKLATHKEANINDFKRVVFDYLIKNMERVKQNKDQFLEYFDKHNYLKDKQVSFILNSKEQIGIVKGVDDHFNLLINYENKEISVNSGEINLIKEIL